MVRLDENSVIGTNPAPPHAHEPPYRRVHEKIREPNMVKKRSAIRRVGRCGSCRTAPLGAGVRHVAEITLRSTLRPPVPSRQDLSGPVGRRSKGFLVALKVQPLSGPLQLCGKAPRYLDSGSVTDVLFDIVWTLPGFSPGRHARIEPSSPHSYTRTQLSTASGPAGTNQTSIWAKAPRL